MLTAVPFRLLLKCCSRLTEKRISFIFSLLLLLSANTWSQCTTPTATIAVQPGSNPCNGQPFNLILSNTATGISPFDLTINGNTYSDIAPGAVVTTFTPPTEKLWPGAPGVIPPTNEDASVTLGVKFKSSVSGYVKGVRFYSSDDAVLAPGSYTGQLWSSDGTLLASGTFSNVTSSDWQELVFTTPVLISANTTYVASYHTNGTKYVGTIGGFSSSIVNGSLTAPDNVSSGGNGVYAYGSAASFPGQSVGANYWVDVMFSPNVYSFNLTGIKDANECTSSGSLQTLNVTSADCGVLPVNLVINPPATTAAVGQSFTVFVNADFSGPASSLGLNEVELHLAFDNNKLSVTSIVEQPVAAAFTTKPIPVEGVPYTNTNAAGQINYAASTTGSIPTSDFNVLAITFTVTGGSGTSTSLTLRRDAPADETIARINGSSVLAGVVNSTIHINPAGCITPVVTMFAQSPLGTCNGQPFDLVLSNTATGVAPFDLTVTGPAGTATYTDIMPGDVISNFTPPVEKIWPAAPAIIPPTHEDASVTLGVKFKSSVAGIVKGVRFFSPDDIDETPGSYTGQLWTATGTLVASGTFTDVTADNWQELIFTSPVSIDANTIYIASYHTNGSKYVGTSSGFITAVTNGSLTAPDNASAGGNGVYAYGATASFPNQSVGGNYWVDVIFTSTTYSFTLTSITDANGCSSEGVLQTLNISAGNCGGNSLPVTLTNLWAITKEDDVTLQWTTSSEINNLGFEVQRSMDGANWSALGFVTGAGNSTAVQRYMYLDQKLPRGNRYYYRLKQIDIDKRFEYSPVISVKIDAPEGFVLEQNYPNPSRSTTTIRFTLPRSAKVNLSLYDLSGRLVKVLINDTNDPGMHAVNLNTGTLPKGLYYYKLQAGEFSSVKKLVIQ
jgi:hypothetical protein